jgi:uncharacterized protein (UPF0548 family)
MFYFTRPDKHRIDAFHEAALDEPFSYFELGATASDELPSGYQIDRNRVDLGSGDAVFAAAKKAVHNWKMFDIGWVEIFDARTPIEKGETATLLISHLGFYSLNSARIVYTIDEPSRFGFAYGTLACHSEIGEERFCVTIDEKTGRVSYDILAMSRPGHFLARIGFPVTRHLQRSFARDSLRAMKYATD